MKHFTYSPLAAIPLLVLLVLLSGCRQDDSRTGGWHFLPVKEYREAVYASWVGQIIGNTYGLGYEFKFIDDPGPETFPYGYSGTLEDIRTHNGAYSDDDTDIEYMYLTVMERSGPEPGYAPLAEAWKSHVRERVWFANRRALTLMHAGHYPPVTGMKAFNSEWFQIDPQLVNEIWAVTAPGMIDYAVGKSEFAARITSDDFGLEPTLHYAAMYSAAFFEKDVNRLVDIGLEAVPSNGRFSQAIEDVKKARAAHPGNWQAARKVIVDKYYRVADYNRHSWAAADAILNGALGIMALLYGQGDFQETLDLCCAMGMDADNQAATMCGLLGIVNGMEGIPHHLMFPLDTAGWDHPFNDSYRMITREGLTDASIRDLAGRMAAQGEKIILASGGQILAQEGEIVYKINKNAQFKPPFELNPIPELHGEVNRDLAYPLYTGRSAEEVSIEAAGDLPPGIRLTRKGIEGRPAAPGNYRFVIRAEIEGQVLEVPVVCIIHSQNLASLADSVLFNAHASDTGINLIRDGNDRATYYSIKPDDRQETDYYGYTWPEPVQISALTFNPGATPEFGGWFTTFGVEYLEDGNWKSIASIDVVPPLNLDNSQWLKTAFLDHVFSFPAVITRGIRITGKAGGIGKDAANAHLGMQFYTSISELRVHAH